MREHVVSVLLVATLLAPAVVALPWAEADAALAVADASPSHERGGASNLLANGGFEVDDDLDTVPDGWRAFTRGIAEVARAPSAAQEGIHVAQAALVRTAGALHIGPTGFPLVELRSDPVLVTPGDAMRLSGWIRDPHGRAEVAARIGPHHVTMRPADVPVGYPDGESPAAWHRGVLDFVVPYGVVAMEVSFQVPDSPIDVAAGDDFVLEERPPRRNLLSNGGFEHAFPDGRPLFWAQVDDLPAGGSCGITAHEMVQAPPATEGGWGLRASHINGGLCGVQSHLMPVVAGQAYEMAADARADEGLAGARVRFHHADGTLLDARTIPFDQSGTWASGRLGVCAPPDAAYAQVHLLTENLPRTRSEVHWDAVRFDRLDTPCTWTSEVANLLPDYGFEQGTHVPLGWSLTSCVGSETTLVSDPVHHGAKAWRMAWPGIPHSCDLRASFPVPREASFLSVSYWAHREGGCSRLLLELVRADGSKVTGHHSSLRSGAETYSATFDLPLVIDHVVVRLQGPPYSCAPGVVVWDDVGVTMGVVPVPWPSSS